jgi:hypothetical protein
MTQAADKTAVQQGGAAAARRAHNPEVAGSSPAPATKLDPDIDSVLAGVRIFNLAYWAAFGGAPCAS